MLMKQISMKKLLIAAEIGLGMGLTAHAQGAPEGYLEVENYLESFSSSSVASSRFNGPVSPIGWNALYGDLTVGTTTYKVSYTASSTGQKGSGDYCVGNTSYWFGRGAWNSSTSSYPYYPLYDYIISPQVKGDVSFYVKRSSTSTSETSVPAMKVYRMTKKDDGTFACDTVADLLQSYVTEDFPSTTSEWAKKTVAVDDFSYIGFRLMNCYIDEFSAPLAYIPVNKAISLGTPNYSEGYSYKINSTSDNKWKVGAYIPVTNNSNVPLVAADEGPNYTISFVRVKSTSNPYTYAVLKTVPLPDLEIGETKNVYVEDVFNIEDDYDFNANYNCYRIRLDFVENFSGTSQNKSISSWAEITPYESILGISYERYTSASNHQSQNVDVTKAVNFGAFRNERAIEFNFKNSGAAPLTFEKVTKPDYVTLETLPQAIEPGETVAVKVIIGGEAGHKEGAVEFETNGIMTVDRIPFVADVVGEDEFFSDFETAEDFNQWYRPDNDSKWNVGDWTSTERNNSENFYSIEYNFNDKRLENTYQTPLQHIFTPKLAFNEGEEISFYAAKKTNSGDDVKLVVRYSPDRVNWTELGTIKVTNNENPDLQFSSGTSTTPTSTGQNIMKHFAFAMPEGEYYVSLGAGYVLVDNFHGGKLVDVYYDIAPISAEAGKTRMVNNALDFSATFRNLFSEAVPADDQVVSLYADGEVVASTEAKEIAGSGTVIYDLSYVPHKVGETELYAEIAIGDCVVKSAVVSVNVLEESALEKNTVGNPENPGTNINLPFTPNYKNSKSEMIYTADMLAGLAGDEIRQISYLYYKTSADQTGEITIWMENTEDTEVVGVTDTESLERVFNDSKYQIVANGGNNAATATEMVFTFDTPFKYTGNNIRIVFEKLGDDYKAATFITDKEMTSVLNYYANDTRSTYDNDKDTSVGNLKSSQMPVINFYTAMEVAEATGTVTSTEGGAVVGATVRATAVATEENPDVDVYYETTTDEAGEWSMQIFQSEYEYTLTVRALGYESYEGEEGAMSLTEPNDVELVKILLGDANDNGDVTVADVVTIANYLVGITNENSWSTTKADINGDGKVSIDDLQAVVNIILGITDDSKRNSNAMTVNDKLIADDFRVTGREQFEIPVRLVNTKDYTQLQADIIIPDGMVIEKVTKGERASSHTIISNEVDGVLKIVIYNFGTTPFADIDGALFNLVVTADEECGNIRMENIFVSDARANAYELNYEGGANLTGTTGVDGIEADRNGVRYFTVDGIEVFNPEKGRILIRVEGGKAKKVVF